MSEQPNVLRLSDMLESCSLHVGDIEQYHAGIALRRLHEVNAALLRRCRSTLSGSRPKRTTRKRTSTSGWRCAGRRSKLPVPPRLSPSANKEPTMYLDTQEIRLLKAALLLAVVLTVWGM